MFFNVAHENSGRSGRICDVMMMYGHYNIFGARFEISTYLPTHIERADLMISSCIAILMH